VNPAAFLTLSATVAIAALTPGPAVTAIVARAISDGWRPAMAVNAGVVTGDLLFFALAAAGMAAAARTLGDLFAVIGIAGAAYLAWQGVKLWRAKPRVAATAPVGHEGHFWPNYGAGLLLMMSHVQAMIFYAALMPGFVDLATLQGADFALLGAMLVVVIGGINSGYAFLASRARRFFADERALRLMNRVAGTLMFIAAALVASRV
jgi:threonine/homoserine/homoserine lactone efflux protein